MKDQQNTTKRIGRIAGATLAALASLTVAVGCGGEPSADEVDIPAKLEAAGFSDVKVRSGDDKISYIGDGADEKEITSEESVEALIDPKDDYSQVVVERFETPEDAAEVAEEYEDDTMETEVVSERIVVYAEQGENFDKTLDAITE